MKTIHEAGRAFRQEKLTPLDVLEECLAHIGGWEDRVRAWVFVDREGARAEARRLTEELRRGQNRGPLHGIPVGIKDIFDVRDWPTAAGFGLWTQSIARQDAEVVRRLREAGAIFLGKTVTTQFASFDPPVTRNPWNLERTPGGSSSGSAAALATGMCLGAIGSQTGGSITRPAAYCGVTGLKPTFGLTSCNGVVPLAPTLDHPGPMARCVKDLGLLLQVMVTPEGCSTLGPAPNFQFHLTEQISSPRLGRVRGLFEDQAEPCVQQIMDATQQVLNQALPQPMAEVALPASFGEVIANHRTIMAVEAAEYHQIRFQRHLQEYQPRIRSLIEEGLACPAPEYRRCLEHQQRLKRDMAGYFAHFDALIMPATPGPAPAADSTGSPVFNSPWSYTGLPTVCLPIGQFVAGLPLSLQLVGGPGREFSLLGAARWCEQVLEVGILEPKEKLPCENKSSQ